MKAKSLLLALGAAAVGTLAYAYTETVETMTVELLDGQKIEYKIEDVSKVSFDSREETIGFLLTDANEAELFRSGAVAPMFRYAPEAEGANVKFLFGSADNAADLAGLKDGKYMVILELTSAGLYAENVSLAGDATAATVKLYEWADGEISATNESVSEGTVTTSRNAKGVVTMELDAKFADGTALRASYSGSPVDVADLEAIFPTPAPKNELNYYNADGNRTLTASILSFKKTTPTTGSYAGMNKYVGEVEDAYDSYKLELYMFPEFVGQEIDFSTFTSEGANGMCGVYVNFEYFQLGTANSQSRYTGVMGTLKITENEDGTLAVVGEIYNTYKNPWVSGISNQGTKEHISIDYLGACDGLAPAEPEPTNKAIYYNADGTATITADVLSWKKTVLSASSRFAGMVKYTAELDENHDNKLEIQLMPEFIGQEVDFSTVTATEMPAAYFHFDQIQVMSANTKGLGFEGIQGKIKVVENADGTITVKADVSNLYKNPWGSGTAGTPERVTIDSKAACTGL